MIQKIDLRSFGRFQNQSFDLKPVTLFRGANEAGKTTLLDAFAWGLGIQKLPANKPFKKKILSRYGQEEQLNVQLTGKLPQLEEKDLELFWHTIFLREARQDPKDTFWEEDDWDSSLQAKLLSQGTNLQDCIDLLQKKIQPRQGTNHFKEEVKVKQELESIQMKLESLTKQWEENVHDQAREKNSQQKILSLKEEERQLQRKIKGLEETANSLQLATRKLVIQNLLAVELVWKTSESNFEQLRFYEVDRSSELRKLETEKTNKERLQYELQRQKETLSTQKLSLESEQRELKTSLEKQKICIDRLSEFQQKIERARSSQSWFREQVESKPKPGARAFGLGFFVLGLVSWGLGWHLLEPESLGRTVLWGSALLFTLLGLGGFFWKVTRILQIEDPLLKQKFFQNLELDWRIEFTPAFPLADERAWEHLARTLWESQTKTKTELAEKETQLANLEREIGRTIQAVSENQDALSSLTREIGDWLHSAKVANLLEYENLTRSALTAKQDFLAKTETLQQAAKNTDLVNFFLGLRAEWETLQHLPIPEEIENQKLQNQNQITEAKASLSSCTAEIHELEKFLERQAGARSYRLPWEREILELFKRKTELEEELEKRKIRREAQIEAKKLLEQMNQDQTSLFQAVSKEMKEHLNSLFQEREFEWNDIEKSSLQWEDALGTKRPLANLSQGTKQLFYLVFRLFLLKKLVQENPVLFLDDSLHFFDEERLAKILHYLFELQKSTGVQLIFFTKPNRIEALVQGVFPDTQIYELSSNKTT